MIGAWALFLMYAWLLAAIVASYLSGRKGYGEKVGLASGLLLHLVGVIIWLVVPAKEHSKWKTVGPFGRRKAADLAPRAAQAQDSDDASPSGSRAASV
jgi:type II secretory pathway component PulM